MSKLYDNDFGYSLIKTIIIVFLIIVVVAIAYIAVYNNNQTYNNTSTTSETSSVGTNTFKILPPATVPSKAAECSQQVTYYSDGTSGPVKCSNGNLNDLEWNSLSALEPKIFQLGYSATTTQIQTALCADVHANIKNNIEEVNYQMASLYYGWNFSSNPSAVISNGTCVNNDD